MEGDWFYIVLAWSVSVIGLVGLIAWFVIRHVRAARAALPQRERTHAASSGKMAREQTTP